MLVRAESAQINILCISRVSVGDGDVYTLQAFLTIHPPSIQKTFLCTKLLTDMKVTSRNQQGPFCDSQLSKDMEREVL